MVLISVMLVYSINLTYSDIVIVFDTNLPNYENDELVTDLEVF